MIMISIADIPKSQQHDHAHRLLRECLRTQGIDYSADTAVTFGEHGKPSLTDYPSVHYNLSHSDGIAACIVSDVECGIDCERVREFRPNVMGRVFSDSERELVEQSDDSSLDMMFFRLWTLKEAYIKAIGIGLSFPMNRVEFAFEGERVISNVPDWKFRQHILRNGEYVVSICEQIVNNHPQY